MEVKNVKFSYGDKTVIDDLSMSLSGGRRIAVMGESGRGKTTLLKLLLGILTPSAGVIERASGEKPAVVFQEDRLLPWFSAKKNVSYSAAPGVSVEDILRDMELYDSMDKLPKELSGGMQRRAAIARALAFSGDPLLLDEPFKGLDPDMRERVAKKILLHAKNASILLITHDEHEAELLNCDEIIRL
ncbi:MAG: ATP-binding cassette domain-containing protein [Clostridiales bacterium]|nr:ATP-binding cassette domain-containing protein [Clostridiales bacterium]